MSDSNSNDGITPDSAGNTAAVTNEKPVKKQLRKVLPAKKISSQKQFEILRAFAIASTHERHPVVISDVANVLQIHQNSVSICNPFFADTGLITKQGHKFIPAEAVISYSDRMHWNDQSASHKLAPIIQKTWFAEAILPRATLRPLQEEEALSIFADESGASPDQKTQLIMLVDYLVFCGLLSRENGNLRLGEMASPGVKGAPFGDDQNEQEKYKSEVVPKPTVPANTDVFEIPIPGKESAKIEVPKNLSDEDWEMLKIMLDAYITRLKGSH